MLKGILQSVLCINFIHICAGALKAYGYVLNSTTGNVGTGDGCII